MSIQEILALAGIVITVLITVVAFFMSLNSKMTEISTKQKDIAEDSKETKNTVNTFAKFMVEVSGEMGSVKASAKSAHKRIDEQSQIMKCHDDLLKEHGIEIENLKKSKGE